MKRHIKNQQKLVNDWNKKYPVGQKVMVLKDDGSEVKTITTHEATMLGGHTAVGWFKDIKGCYALQRVRAI